MIEGTGNQSRDTEALLNAAEKGGCIEVSGEFHLDAPVVLSRRWSALKGYAKLVALHDGPVVHCQHFNQTLSGLTISSHPSRTAGVGILKSAQDRPGQHGKFQYWHDIRVELQPSHGIVISASFSALELSRFEIDGCGGNGIQVDDGLDRQIQYRPGGIKAHLGVIKDSGGHAVKCGGEEGMNYPYRVRFENIDTYRSGSPHAWWIYGSNIDVVQCGLGCEDQRHALFVAGRSVHLKNNRYIRSLAKVIDVGHVEADGIATRGVYLDEAHVSGAVAANPLCHIHERCRAIEVVSRSYQNIEKAVNDDAPEDTRVRIG